MIATKTTTPNRGTNGHSVCVATGQPVVVAVIHWLKAVGRIAAPTMNVRKMVMTNPMESFMFGEGF